MRQWNQKLEVDNIVGSQSWAKDLTLAHHSFENTTFCEQVRIMSQTAVMIAPHGAAVAGNSVFMHDRSVIVELGSMYTDSSQTSTNDLLQAPSANIEMARIAGRFYVGSMSITTYSFMGEKSFDVDLDRFNTSLGRVDDLLHLDFDCHHKPPPRVCASVPHNADACRGTHLLFVWAQIASWACVIVAFVGAAGVTRTNVVTLAQNAKRAMCAANSRLGAERDMCAAKANLVSKPPLYASNEMTGTPESSTMRHPPM